MSNRKYAINDRAAALFVRWRMGFDVDSTANFMGIDANKVREYENNEPETGEDISDYFAVASVIFDDESIQQYVGFTDEFVAKRIVRDVLDEPVFNNLRDNLIKNKISFRDYLDDDNNQKHLKIDRIHWND